MGSFLTLFVVLTLTLICSPSANASILTVIVRDAITGAPIPQAIVNIGLGDFLTDAQGKVAGDIAHGNYFGSVKKAGYQTVSGPFSFTGAATVNIALTPAKAVITNVAASMVGPSVTEAAITWTVAANASGSPVEYRFFVYEAHSSRWVYNGVYTSSNSFLYRPSIPGRYHIQVWVRAKGSTAAYEDWRNSAQIDVNPATVVVCSELSQLSTNQNAGAIIQDCINRAPGYSIVELPPGVYRIDSQIRLENKPITIRTQGKTESMSPCALNRHDCAELKASVNLKVSFGIFMAYNTSLRMDHLVFNGNKAERDQVLRPYCQGQGAAQSPAGDITFGATMVVHADNGTRITNSVFKNAVCLNGLAINYNKNTTLKNNIFANNGTHNVNMMWSDGLSLGSSENSQIIENTFIDNTDIDFVMGGCKNCVISDNKVIHSTAHASASFGGISINDWGSEALTDYSGTMIERNSIDCSEKQRCGFGLLIGIDPWYPKVITGNADTLVRNNYVANAQQCIAVQSARNFTLIGNTIAGACGGTFLDQNRVPVATNRFNVSPSSQGIISDMTPSNFDFAGHILAYPFQDW